MLTVRSVSIPVLASGRESQVNRSDSAFTPRPRAPNVILRYPEGRPRPCDRRGNPLRRDARARVAGPSRSGPVSLADAVRVDLPATAEAPGLARGEVRGALSKLGLD